METILSFFEIVGDAFAPLISFFNTLIGGILLLAVLVGLLLICVLALFRSRGKKSGGVSPKGTHIEPVISDTREAETQSSLSPAQTSDVTGNDAGDIDENSSTSGANTSTGFTFFKRKKKTVPSSDFGEEGGHLNAVEQEMLAIRQLYINGHISKDVYVAETRALYERAQSSIQ